MSQGEFLLYQTVPTINGHLRVLYQDGELAAD